MTALVLAGCLGTALLAGCGSEKSTSTSSTETSSTEETETTESTESTETATTSSGETRELTLSIGNPEGSDNWEKYSAFTDAVEELSGGTLTVKIYASGTLASDQEALQALMDGTVDFAHVTPAAASGTIADVGVLDLPGVFTYKSVDDDTSLKEFEAAVHDTLDSIYADYGVKYLAMNQPCQAVIVMNDELVTEPEDLQNKAMRTSGQWLGRLLESWGASATSLDMSDLTTALERNTVQGTLTAYGVVGSNKLYEVAPYLTYFNTTNNVASLIMCGDTWDSLTEEEQGWIEEAAQEFMDAGPEIGEKFYNQYREEFEEGGAEIYDLSEEEEAAFFENMDELYDEIEANCTDKGLELIDEIEEFNANQN